MRVVQPFAKLMPASGATLRKIEWCARISHRSEEAQTENSWERFVKSVVIDHGDWSVVEHVTASVDFLVDRGITHEIVRHRLFSYTQESTRFVNYQKKIPPSFIYPDVLVSCPRCIAGEEPQNWKSVNNSYCHDGPPGVTVCPYEVSWLSAIDYAETSYRYLIGRGWRPQEARSVFPNALASRLIMTGNLRSWRHFLIMRTTLEAHPQMRQVTIPLLEEFKESFPILFDDIIPNQKQSEAMKKAQ